MTEQDWRGSAPLPYPGQPMVGYPVPVVVRPSRTNGMAIASMVLGILWLWWVGSILAVIFGHVALSQTKKDPSQGGRGMAIAGVVLGWIGVAVLILALLAAAGASGS